MKCPHHPKQDVAGYCAVCGAFGCDECLTNHQGQLLCSKHYKPVEAEKEREKKFAKARKRQARQRLVVHYKDGTIERGVCFALNPRDSDFHLNKVDDRGITTDDSIHIRFEDLKAVFYVKHFHGRKRKHTGDDNHTHHNPFQDSTVEGSDVIVKFNDTEVIKGHTVHPYNPDEKRFFLIPDDPEDNNISILVEKSALEAVYTPEEYEEIKRAERERRQQEAKQGSAQLSQEETMGDFYFETRNYPVALQHYQEAEKKAGATNRLRKKIVISKFNIGMQHIKRREYAEALECIEEVLKFAPENKSALKKRAQLKRILHKEKKRQSKEEEFEENPSA